MKHVRKLLTMLMAVIMTLAMTVSAFAAAPQTGNLTVRVNANNSLNGQTLKVYKLFSLTKNGGNYGYVVNPEFKDAIEGALSKTDLTNDQLYDEVSKLAPDNSVAVQDFANKLVGKLLADGTPETATSGVLGEAAEYKFENLEYGYYLVYQTGPQTLQASLVSVDKDDVQVNLKGEKPSITKNADKETVEIDEIVTYTVKGKIPDVGQSEYVYKIHDTLSTGLDFVKDADGAALDNSAQMSVSVQINGAGAETIEAAVNDRTMVLDLSDWVKNHQNQKGQSFTVTYYAKVNADAVVTENNQAKLEYGNKPGTTEMTVPVEVHTPTYPLQVKKTDKNTNQILAGAKFRLYRSLEDANKANGNEIKVTQVKPGDYVFDKESANIDMVTAVAEVDTGFNLRVNGLKAGDYYLVETEAPAGYNKITRPIKITVHKSVDDNVNNWTLEKDGEIVQDKIIIVENSTGTLLPGTGGMGTAIFTIIGVAMIAGIAISFVTSRKKVS